MKHILAVLTVCLLLFTVGCGAKPSNYSKAGAEETAIQLAKENIGNRLGPDTAKAAKIKVTKVKEGLTEGRMFVNCTAKYKREFMANGEKQVRKDTVNYSFELQHNGTDWNVRDMKFHEE
ncbi:hypothetical protein D3C75_1103840 [compost metagenome]